ncbi:MAG: hypothetical protein CVV64_12160 [Candidatus Wallbacteria bacterium HGW-Wallbacteria-1]|jgi:hypothetical protein|uniref:Uncharacterized protein n=1 Tax=Candidatus Wallbacteria bacterium HGW-Wallbacteria-1 TaxID=2013854 RepID=A0A2N1PNH1_9BACT|nr:MAG: hypothetical protein CVV64_12160 [Candidatus Wallbacteria bacterium HGW-Wallbacteria-1]
MGPIQGSTYGNPVDLYRSLKSSNSEPRSEEVKETPKQEASEPVAEDRVESRASAPEPQTQPQASQSPPNPSGLGYNFDSYA